MKTVLVLRHGKSDWGADHGSDHDRPLAKRGHRAAARIGRFVRRAGQIPDLVLSSTAVRAWRTAELAMEAGQWDCPLEGDPDLYGARAPSVLDMIRDQDDAITSLLLVGHQPTWSELVALLSGAVTRFPTAALARIDFAVDTWTEVQAHAGTLIWLVTPKLLEKKDSGP